ncbi:MULTISPECIES: WG repeat-containing protein [Moraxella]|uniref:WG repeat-containing protein n=1 Tax=Moraxella catarrhalis TaxID=480 RepID=A0A7Z1A3R4_MORCA|nr:WG repeat-containing protein [Moraxella catarrhalis]OAV00258.1 hypothetical protein AO382_1408 [Moraxella catarrhalis]STY82525.1 KWG Leptospira [Moraxella catarrhalis]
MNIKPTITILPIIALMMAVPTLANTISTHSFDDDDLPACAATPLPEDTEFATIDSDCGYSEGLAPIVKAGKYGYVDSTGKVVIPAIYQEAYPFSDGLALYRHRDKYGYLNKSGKVAIHPRFTDAWGFWEGRAKIEQDGKYGFIDTSGNIVIRPKYEVIGDWFEEGLVLFKQKDKYGFLDKSGKVAIRPQFDSAKDFSEGLAAVTMKSGQTDEYGEPLHKYGFIDKTGKVVIDIKYDLAYDFLSGAAYVVDGDEAYYIDKSGNQTVIPRYIDPKIDSSLDK